MPRRSNANKPQEAAPQKPATRFTRRRRRRAGSAKPRPEVVSSQKSRPGDADLASFEEPMASRPPMRIGKAPRPAEPPPPNPNVFSYTYTIWKSS